MEEYSEDSSSFESVDDAQLQYILHEFLYVHFGINSD